MDHWNESEPILRPENPGEDSPGPAPAPETNRPKGGKILALALVFSLLGGAVGAGGVMLGLRAFSGTNAREGASLLLEGTRTGAVVETMAVETGELLSPSQVYAQNVNSTVGITTAVTTNFWGYQTTSAASGSGFILSSDGYILTNYHVIESSESITVTLCDGSAYEAELIGFDETNDVAVLKVEAEGLSPVILGRSDSLLVGDSVVAIGNPLGELTFSLTVGVVSALDRDITLSSGASRNLIQTDCAINSGNSGGALFNLYGEVIGITNAKYSSGGLGEASIDNIGFAIPVDQVRGIVESIIENGYVARPYIGVSVADVSAESRSYGLPEGAAVKAVTEDGPADKAGLELNDIITEANGHPITGSADLVEIVGAMNPGDKLELSVYRQGESLSVTVTVDESIRDALTPEEEPAAQARIPEPETMPDFGFPFDFEDFFGMY